MRTLLLQSACALSLVGAGTGWAIGKAPSAAWPEFRGPSGQGEVAGELPLRWSEGSGIAWKTPLPGRGWSTPAIGDGRIWLTTAEEHQAEDALKEQLLKRVEGIPVAADMYAVASVTLSALEVDLASGKLLRQIRLFDVPAPPPIHGLNSFASPSPVLAQGRLYCHFGCLGTACLDVHSGAVLWRRKLAIDHIVGPGSSPAAYGGVLIVPCYGSDQQFITALDLATGETAWQRSRPPIRETNPDQRKAFCTPLIIDVNGRPQAVVPGAQWFVAYDPLSGDELWRVDHDSGFSNVPRPVFDGKHVYLCSGFGQRSLWAVRPDGAGDVTATHVGWRRDRQAPTMSSPVVSQGRMYGVSDGVATCWEAESGRTLWRRRLGGQFSASPLAGAGRVYLLSQEGLTTVIADAAEFTVLAENQLEGRLMASPAAVEGHFILRTDSHLYRVVGDERGAAR